MNKGGYLELILGCMWAGKSTKLISLFKRYKLCGMDPIVINFSAIKNDSNEMITHDNQKIKCFFVETLSEINYDTSVYLINEGQFFSDLYQWVTHKINKENKTIYIAALDGDFQRKGFDNILQLIPETDKIEKLPAICSQCKNGTHAIFTKRINSNKEKIVLNDNIYQPLCRICYNKSI